MYIHLLQPAFCKVCYSTLDVHCAKPRPHHDTSWSRLYLCYIRPRKCETIPSCNRGLNCQPMEARWWLNIWRPIICGLQGPVRFWPAATWHHKQKMQMKNIVYEFLLPWFSWTNKPSTQLEISMMSALKYPLQHDCNHQKPSVFSCSVPAPFSLAIRLSCQTNMWEKWSVCFQLG